MKTTAARPIAARRPRAVIYCRVSTAGQADSGLSLDAQEHRCRAACAHLGYEVAEVLVDVASGKSTARRPALARAREMVRAGEVQAVVALRLDRVARRALDVLGLVEDLQKSGATLASATEGFDAATPAGKMMVTVLGAAAELERNLISERTREGLAEARARGVRLGRPPVAVPAALLDRLLELRDQGRTWKQVAQTLNAEGYTAPTGGRLYPTTCQRLLKRARKEAA